MAKTREPAAQLPVARVLPLLGLAHLDRVFDYLIEDDMDAEAQPGVRVRVRFAGRLVDAILISREAKSDHEGKLAWLERVISPEVVYPEKTRKLVESLCERYAGVRSDLIRSAIPARHAGAESSEVDTPWEELGEVEEPDLSGWLSYLHGESFVDAVLAGNTARAAWQITPGDQWADILAALAVKTVKDGGGALIVLPSQREVDRLESALRKLVTAKQVTVLNAGLGPQARYRRFLSILHGQGRLVIGTRSAAFAPVQDLRLAVVVHDHDENLVDPRAPYFHAREVLTTRSQLEGCSLLIAGYSRTAETQLMVEKGWAHDLVSPREVVRQKMPRVHAVGETDFELERDPLARQARLPKKAFDALRASLERGKPVLVQVPRKGYVPTLACGTCRTPARCRACNGPLGLPKSHDDQPAVPTCRWCGRPETRFHCHSCGSPKLRAVVLGTERTAEELGKAFPQVPVVLSGGNKIVDAIDEHACVVVATPGAEPEVTDGSYGSALFLDTWSQLGRADLRATELTIANWAGTAAMVESNAKGGEVIIVADVGLFPVQALIRWDMVGAARIELSQRAEVSFPPTVHMAAIDGAMSSLDAFLELADLPEGAEVLGPVDLPLGVSLPGEYDESTYGPAQRMLIRTPLGPRAELGKALRAALIARAARKDDLPLRVQVDPIQIG